MGTAESAGSILRKFAQAGGDPTTARDSKGWTALHLVVIVDSAVPLAPAVTPCVIPPIAYRSVVTHFLYLWPGAARYATCRLLDQSNVLTGYCDTMPT